MNINAGQPASTLDQQKPRRRGTRLLRALLRQAGVAEWVAAVFFGCALTAVALPAVIATGSPLFQSLIHSLQAPGSAALFGTDQLGRDEFSRVVYGARYSLGIGGGAAALGAIAGLMLGLTAGFRGGALDDVVVRVADLVMSVPTILMGLLALSFSKASVLTLVVVLGIAASPLFIRMVRVETLRVRSELYVEAAVSVGADTSRVLLQHVLPNILPVLLTVLLIEIPPLILAEASLSYLGVGVRQPAPAWGAMLQDGSRLVRTAWWLTVFPGLALTLTVLALSVLGDWLRRAGDPRRG